MAMELLHWRDVKVTGVIASTHGGVKDGSGASGR